MKELYKKHKTGIIIGVIGSIIGASILHLFKVIIGFAPKVVPSIWQTIINCVYASAAHASNAHMLNTFIACVYAAIAGIILSIFQNADDHEKEKIVKNEEIINRNSQNENERLIDKSDLFEESNKKEHETENAKSEIASAKKMRRFLAMFILYYAFFTLFLLVTSFIPVNKWDQFEDKVQ